MSLRQPAVAGSFYPGERHALAGDLAGYLEQNPCDQVRPKALVVPHAGYIYSGPVAARAYNLLKPLADTIERVVLLGPSHRVSLAGLALPADDVFLTPLGEVDLDLPLMELLSELPQVRVMPQAHSQEHSLEVQLPFLQTVLNRFTLVPLVVGQIEAEAVAEVLNIAWGGEETLILISSDLSHYHDYLHAQRLDRETSDAICHLQGDLSGHQACGCFPLNGLLLAAERHGLRAEVLDLRNSGDTAGTKDSVVGYGAYAFH